MMFPMITKNLSDTTEEYIDKYAAKLKSMESE